MFLFIQIKVIIKSVCRPLQVKKENKNNKVYLNTLHYTQLLFIVFDKLYFYKILCYCKDQQMRNFPTKTNKTSTTKHDAAVVSQLC